MQDSPKQKSKRKRWLLPRFGLRAFIGFVLLVAIVIGMYAERARQQKRVCEELTSNSIRWGFANPPSILEHWPKSWGDPANNHWFCSIKWIDYEEKHSFSEKLLKPKEALELIATIPNVQWLYLSFAPSAYGKSELSDVLAQIATIRALNTLSVDTENNDAFMAACAPIHNLRDLRLNTTLSDEGLKHLSKFPNLQEFSSNSRHLKGSGLGAIAKLAHIQNVELIHLACTLSELKPFREHRTLRSFSSDTVCTDQMLELFSTCPNLRTIDANNSTITNDGMPFVAKMKSLQRISLANVAVSDVGFAALAHCPHLQYINGEGCKLTNAIGDTLIQLPELASLHLAHTLTNAKLLADLKQCKKLSDISLGNSNAELKQVLDFAMNRSPAHKLRNWGPPSWRTAYVLFGLKQFPNAEDFSSSFDLSNLLGIHGQLRQAPPGNFFEQMNVSNTDIDDSDLAVLAQSYNFTVLNISNTNVTAQGLSVLSNHSALSQLILGPIDDMSQALASIGNLSRLYALNIVDGKRLVEADFKALASLTNVKYLTIDGGIDEAARAILDKSTSIEYVSAGLHGFTRNGYGGNGLGLHYVTEPRTITDERDLAPLASMHMGHLSVRIPSISDDAAKAIGDISLNSLDLSRCGLKDDQLKFLIESNLQELTLNDNPITDKSIEYLLQYKFLNNLKIASTQITNRGLSQILGVLPLKELDISGTAIDAEAWHAAEFIDQIEIETLVVKDNTSAISMMTKLPIDLLPRSIIIDSEGTSIDSELLRALRSEPSDQIQRGGFDVPVVPSTLGAWSIEQLLTAGSAGPFVTISRTGKSVEILEHLVHFPNFTHIQINNDIFERPLKEIPQQVRTMTLTSCKLDSQAVESIAQFPWLRSLHIDSCNLEGCSLEPLSRLTLLGRLMISDSNLSPDQLQTLNRLKPALLDAQGW